MQLIRSCADWLKNNSNDPLEPPDYLTAGNRMQDTGDHVREAAEKAGEDSTGEENEPRGRRRLNRRFRGGQNSAIKRSSSATPGRAPGANAAGKGRSENISTTTTGARPAHIDQQGRPPPASVSSMDPQYRAEKIRKLKVD